MSAGHATWLLFVGESVVPRGPLSLGHCVCNSLAIAPQTRRLCSGGPRFGTSPGGQNPAPGPVIAPDVGHNGNGREGRRGDRQPARVARRVGGRSRLACYGAPIGAQSTLDGAFFALSDPTRRGILERLGGGSATISDLARSYELTINGVKKHVGILERADLVVTEKVGRSRHCRLGSASLGEATEWIEAYRRAWEERLDRFQRYVERSRR